MCGNERCSYPDGIKMEITGIEVDPCVFEDTEVYTNVTIYISRCVNCGRVQIEWEKQDNTEQIFPPDSER